MLAGRPAGSGDRQIATILSISIEIGDEDIDARGGGRAGEAATPRGARGAAPVSAK